MFVVVKRLFDILLSILGIAIMITITPIIKISFIVCKDYDSIFYTQYRFGKNNKLFKLYKFRTMFVDADKNIENILKSKKYSKEWEKTQKLKIDPRVTKVGYFLRNSMIDEIPQFINVLKGEMSIIGPRPYLPREKDIVGDKLNIITNQKPGITGYWQVYKKRIIYLKIELN